MHVSTCIHVSTMYMYLHLLVLSLLLYELLDQCHLQNSVINSNKAS